VGRLLIRNNGIAAHQEKARQREQRGNIGGMAAEIIGDIRASKTRQRRRKSDASGVKNRRRDGINVNIKQRKPKSGGDASAKAGVSARIAAETSSGEEM